METSVLLYSLTLVRIELRREEGIVFGHFLAKLALVLLLELAETCSTLKMEMSRSWFDENSKREAWFLRAKLALFLSTSSLHLTAPEVDPALHCISFKTDLHWIGAKYVRSFYVFINDFVVFPEKCIEFGIDLICLFSTKLLHL